jgi:hypothetical protein
MPAALADAADERMKMGFVAHDGPPFDEQMPAKNVIGSERRWLKTKHEPCRMAVRAVLHRQVFLHLPLQNSP